jgi:hypothetical protein
MSTFAEGFDLAAILISLAVWQIWPTLRHAAFAFAELI